MPHRDTEPNPLLQPFISSLVLWILKSNILDNSGMIDLESNSHLIKMTSNWIKDVNLQPSSTALKVIIHIFLYFDY